MDSNEDLSHHYYLAHYVLRYSALMNPLTYVGLSVSPLIGKLVEHLFEKLEGLCGKPVPFTIDQVKFYPRKVNEFPLVVIELPEPQEVAEAYFVALYVPVDPSADPLPSNSEIQARFFTLEKGFTLDDSSRTVLGEWSETTHSNLGTGPDPKLENFVQALTAMLIR